MSCELACQAARKEGRLGKLRTIASWSFEGRELEKRRVVAGLHLGGPRAKKGSDQPTSDLVTCVASPQAKEISGSVVCWSQCLTSFREPIEHTFSQLHSQGQWPHTCSLRSAIIGIFTHDMASEA